VWQLQQTHPVGRSQLNAVKFVVFDEFKRFVEVIADFIGYNRKNCAPRHWL